MRNISIEEGVKAVKRHFEKGESCASIAASMGIGYSTICNWCLIMKVGEWKPLNIPETNIIHSNLRQRQ